MTDQHVETVIRSLDKVWDTMDELWQLQHCLEALNIISEHLSSVAISDYCKRINQPSYELTGQVGTQIEMISDYANRARDILRAYEDKLRSEIEKSQLLLSKISPESSDTNPAAPSTKYALETCTTLIVDNSDSPDYYYL